MSTLLETFVDIYDSSIDAVRRAAGLEPIAPVLNRLEFDRRPKAHEPVALKIETRRAARTFVRIEQEQQILFEGTPPRNGQVVIVPFSLAFIRLLVGLESRHPTARHARIDAEMITEPLPNGPPVELDAPSRVVFNDTFACAWHAPAAERVHLAVIEDADVDEQTGPASGQRVVRPLRPGRVLLRLTAENACGQTTLTHSVDVVVPRPEIVLPRPARQAGYPGSVVTFEFRVFRADSLWLVSPGCDKPERLRDKTGGFLSVTLGAEPVEFHLIARGYGDEEHSVTLTAIPQPFAGLGSD